ncbi:MAG: hypothetical protein VX772_05385 [Bacteroidota bacterium]|nr:hypothetical protein [Bacteroidota bacterium]
MKDYIASKPKEDEEEEDKNDDKITMNSKGVITNVERDDGPNRFFDEDGNELFYHDSEGVDKPYTKFKYNKGERLYYSVSIEEINNEIISNGLIMQRYLSNTSNPAGAVYYMWSLLSARGKSQGGFDFAEGYLVSFINNPGRNDTKGRANYNDDAGFFRLGNSNNIYNLYDAGNYMWGRAMGMSGFSYGEIRGGSQLNEGFRDSEADQRAIKKGFNGN